MTALSQDSEGTTDGHMEDKIMAELGQAGGPEEGAESDAPAPVVSAALMVLSVPDI